MKYGLKIIVLILALFASAHIGAQPAYAKADEVYTGWRSNMAVGGYDVVSFHQGNPIKGQHKISTIWKGAQWRFASQMNLDRFLKEPEKYAPAYGGYCAWAIAKGKLAKGSPKHWSVRDGRLYLNFNKKIKDLWLEDPKGFIETADKEWPEILK